MSSSPPVPKIGPAFEREPAEQSRRKRKKKRPIQVWVANGRGGQSVDVLPGCTQNLRIELSGDFCLTYDELASGSWFDIVRGGYDNQLRASVRVLR